MKSLHDIRPKMPITLTENQRQRLAQSHQLGARAWRIRRRPSGRLVIEEKPRWDTRRWYESNGIPAWTNYGDLRALNDRYRRYARFIEDHIEWGEGL